MSRKKKENKVPEQMNLRGNVTLKVMQGNNTLKTIKTHNVVTLNLMYGMLVALSGTATKDYCPNYLGVGSGTVTSQNVYTMETLVQEISQSRSVTIPNYKGMPQKDATTVSTVYQALIPYTSVGSLPIRELGLFGTVTGASLLARIELEEPITLLINQSLMIEWSFSLENKPDSENE